MSQDTDRLLARFHHVLLEEIRDHRPELMSAAFTVAEIYQDLVPYRTHRDRLGVDMNGDYEDVLLRLLAGEGDFLMLESEAARGEIRAELDGGDPNTGIFRDFAAAEVRLNPSRVDVVGGELSFAVESAPAELLPLADDGDEGTPKGEVSPEDLAPEGGQVRSGEPGAATCRWCRAELPRRDNLSYCPFCGTDVHVVPCPSCGEELEPNWRFCIACGAEVTAD